METIRPWTASKRNEKLEWKMNKAEATRDINLCSFWHQESKKRVKCLQQPVFPGGHPSKY